ncbi:MAG TPA: hypothetical protein PK514_00355 [Spirochaetota bacterium]|nr:hypothetical protein [Spirochaetota bacterium]
MLKKIPVFFLVFITLSCNSYYYRQVPNPYEGFKGNMLTVFISEFIPDDKKNSGGQLSPILMDKLNQRAFMILACYVSISVNRSKVSSSNDLLLNKVINSTLSQGRIIQYRFNEKGYCEVFAEYDISVFLSAVDDINNK